MSDEYGEYGPKSDWDEKRVICCGSRSWTDRQLIAETLAKLTPGTIVVHGGALGADRLVEKVAQQLGLRTEVHLPRFDDYDGPTGRFEAPHARNRLLAELGAELCIAFWEDGSKGTQHMLGCAKRAGIQCQIVHPREYNDPHGDTLF